MLGAIALLLSYVESLLPPLWVAVPGIKVGLPNIITVAILYAFGPKDAAAVSLLRVCLANLLFGTPLTFAYSAVGAILSLLLMTLCKKTKMFSVVGVSVVGGISHNLGQILLAVLILDRMEISYYMLVLAVTGTVAGVFIGIAGAALFKQLNKIEKNM